MINTDFWVDQYIHSLKSEMRYFYLYLLTNPHTNITGIYQVPVDYMAVETGLTSEKIINSLKELEAAGKLIYYDGWIILFNKLKWQGEKIKSAIKSDIEKLPINIREKLNQIGYVYHIDRVYDFTLNTIELNTIELSNINKDIKDIDYNIYISIWEKYGYKPKKLTLNSDRKKHLQARLQNKDFDFEKILDTAKKSNDFIQKYITFDWLTKNDTNWRKVIEGNYLNTTESGKEITAAPKIKTL